MQFFLRGFAPVQGLAVGMANLSALALLGVVGGYWTWQWLAPAPEPRLPSAMEPSVQIANALETFGKVQGEAVIPVSSGNAIRLLGVVAAKEGREAYAVVMIDGREILAVRPGQEISPGVTLAEVAPDHVVLDRGGAHESLAWPEKAPVETPGQRPNR